MNRFSMEDIIRYVENEMDDQEKKDFELALETDAQLYADMELYQKIGSSLKAELNQNSAADTAFRNTLKSYNQEYFSRKVDTPVYKISFRKYYYAAAVVLLALFIWAPWNQFNNYDKYFDTKMVSVEVRGETQDKLLLEATNAFNAKDYGIAKSKLRILLNEDGQNDMLKFYYGVSLINTGELNDAKKALNEVYEGESLFKEEAAYYMSLVYIKEKNKEEAKNWLNKIGQDSDFYLKSQELMKKL